MQKIVNFRLILFLAISLCLGIATAYFFLVKNLFFAITIPALFVACLMFFALYKKSAKGGRFIFCAVFIFVFLVGALNFDVKISSYKKADLDNHYYSVTAKVDSVKKTEYGSYAVLSKAHVKGNVEKDLRYKIALYVYGENSLDVGDIVSFNALLLDKDVTYEGRFSSYDVERKIKYTATLDASEVGLKGKDLNLFEKVRLAIRKTLSEGLGEEEFGTAYAMMTGEDEYIAPETLSSFRSAGVAHIFAVSGLHVGIIATALNFIFTKLKLKRLLKAVIITLILIFYSGVCGFSASSVRATIMSAVLLFSAVKGHKYDKYVSISLSCILVLMISPIELFCAGFQLSFSIVFGMFLLSRPTSKLFKFLPHKIASSLGAVISAQLTAIPISLALFDEFSTIAVIVNLLFIPVVGVIFIALFVCTIIGGLFGIEAVTLFLPGLALRLINYCVNAFDFKTFMVGGLTMGGFIVFYYMAMVIISGFIRCKKCLKIILSVGCITIFGIGSAFTTIKDVRSVKAYVVGDTTICATLVENRGDTALIVSGADYNFSTSRLKRLQSKVKDGCIERVFIMADGINPNKFISTMLGVFTFDTIYYFGESDLQKEISFEKSFPHLTLKSIKEGNAVELGEGKAYYSLDGNLITIQSQRYKVGIFACFGGDKVEYASAVADYDLLIAEDMAPSIFALYKPKQEIAYTLKTGYKNAQTGGTVQFLLA